MQRPSGSRFAKIICDHQDMTLLKEQHGLLPAGSAPKKEQGTRLKRSLDQGVIQNMAVPPKFHKHAKRLAVEAEKRNGKESSVRKHEARPHKTPREGSSHGTLMSNKPREHAILSYTPVTWQQQSVISFPAEQHHSFVRPKRYSSVIVQNRAISGPLLLQPQVPNVNKQDSVAAALEWQRKLEAAEALLALRDTPLPPPNFASLQPLGNMPNSYLPEHGPQGSDGEKGLQPRSRHLPRSRAANSVSLTGSLECMSFFT
ncbi:doublesex- and mab-3-related transcription factor C1-like isoform X3 [Rattus norvegicus]|uniref:DMRT-like family C1b n=1 Tax=Rattus norvegicus TaxID=10116 RepID=A0A8I6AV54_RAT|nr:doublesex- and mab-3-related transcription factor C1-like isoform X4 [Rattus norvegicus]|eukprot:XP_006257202.1 PREDICTED: doublesex- and mab-3-related transcription factor C1-like isoform X1 [Rattus norvegicus]